MIRLIGLGNEWTGDDAAGLRVAQSLLPMKSTQFDVQVLGVPEFHMFDGLDEDDLLIVVDACLGGGEVGSISELTLDELSNQHPDGLIRHGSSHGLGLQHWLSMKKELDGITCPILIYAIEMGQIEMGAPLSEEVEASVDKLVKQIKEKFVHASIPTRHTQPDRVSTATSHHMDSPLCGSDERR
jgi:hydrogenase maturation protease